MEVKPNAQACFVDVIEAPQPGAEERTDVRVRVSHQDNAIAFRTLTGVESGTGDEELAIGQPADLGCGVDREFFALGLLATLQDVGLAAAGA
jgi:hypothetical protein